MRTSVIEIEHEWSGRPYDDLVWRALADPTRRAVLDALARRPQTTGELVAHAWPEGGRLVAGFENRVYLEVRDPLERPVDAVFIKPAVRKALEEAWDARHARDVGDVDAGE